jgi:putative DNA primase/helicase
MKGSLDFANVNAAALATILCRLLPGGRIEGHEFVALNPRRNDKRPGSFKIRMSGARAGS